MDNNVVIALLLVMGAGSATALGAMVVFFPFLVKYAKTKTLAAALGLSAGVMMYVSFVEIFQKSQLSFIAAGHNTNQSHIYATACFFGGVVLMVVSLLARCSWRCLLFRWSNVLGNWSYQRSCREGKVRYNWTIHDNATPTANL
jgi:zinc transporter ZupT